MSNERILIVDDEPAWVTLVRVWLESAGYTNLESAGTGTEALSLAQNTPPDCILLDLVLPDQSGTEVCRKLRSLPALSRVPVVLLTAHKRERVMGLQSGADYFVGKSDKPHELLATLDAVFRRRQMEEGTLTQGDVTLKSASRQVWWKGSLVATLTPKMFVLLHVLVQHSPQPVSRGELYKLVEGMDDPGLSRALDVMLNRLRNALPADLSARVVNVKNFGYLFLNTSPALPSQPADQEH
ncbi:MAG TPA: DNA-binding response regulator [Elusimicrobia bacterium]|nr:DNA-binding response regulator [Elusimicrobiota bacterium]HBT62135.1 DNA-binding response regulator [Elusimicrobiota bacterium]